MYDQHFGLTGRPFQLTPDPAFWYETATHRRAMAYLGYGLAQGEGFIVITGDIGAGKTTLVGHLLDTLDREALNPVHLVSTAIEAADLLRIVAMQLGVDPAGLEKAQLLVAIERGLHAVARTGRRTLLIVDEAQALPTSALEELRMLSNFQAGGHALLQIVLLGQPEFRAALHGAEGLEQLRQRVIAIHHLDPMGTGEVAAYVRHRLSVVGWSGQPDFSDDAFAALHRHSDGVPRRLNQLANRVMLHAAVEDLDLVTAATIEAVAADLFADLPTLVAPARVLDTVETHADPAPSEEHVETTDHVEDEPVEAFEAVMEPEPYLEAREDEPVEAFETITEPEAHEDVPVEAAGEVEAPVDLHDDVPMEAAEEQLDARGEASIEAAEEGEAQDGAPVEAVAEAEAREAGGRFAEPAPAHANGRPFRHSWLTTAEPEFAINDDDGPHHQAATADPDETVADRLAALEARIEEQDVALRRVLTLLVDWVENGDSPKAAPMAAEGGYVPIRGAAA